MLVSFKDLKGRVSSELSPGSLSIESFREIIAFPTAGKSSVINMVPRTVDVDAVIQVLYDWSELKQLDHHSALYTNITSAAVSYFLNSFPKDWTLFDFCIRKFARGMDLKVKRLIVVPTGARFVEGWKRRAREYAERGLDEKTLFHEAEEWRSIAYDSPYPVVTLKEGEYLRDLFRNVNPKIDLSTESGRGEDGRAWNRVMNYLLDHQILDDPGQLRRTVRKRKAR